MPAVPLVQFRCTQDITVMVRLKIAASLEVIKEDVDKIIEDEITHKLGEDLLQSIERKFQVDLERSVDMVLIKIKLLLQNGTLHIQDRLSEIQQTLDLMRSHAGDKVDKCLNEKQNQTSALAEKALHQMVVCGYALIGQDPTQAVGKVVAIKDMIKLGVKPCDENSSSDRSGGGLTRYVFSEVRRGDKANLPTSGHYLELLNRKM
ncbi:unnamed protein product, partial [Brenthis ino]